MLQPPIIFVFSIVCFLTDLFFKSVFILAEMYLWTKKIFLPTTASI